MNRQVGLVAALLAAGGLVAWLLAREKSGPGPDPGHGRGPAAGPLKLAPATGAFPGPPSGPGPGPGPSPSPGEDASRDTLNEAFLAEERDATWADEQEAELRRRLAGRRQGGSAGGRLEAPECRHRQCRIIASAPDDGALGQLLDSLQEEGVLYGHADQMVLGAVEDTADGRRRIRVYAQFER